VSEHFKIPTISAGQLLRDEASKGTVLGQEIAKIQKEGKLVSGKIIASAIDSRLELPDCKKGYIMDGFPRNLDQCKAFENLMKKRKEKISALVLLEASNDKLLDRIATRVSCKNGHNFNVKHHPPKKEGVCDLDGFPLHRREDDHEEAILKRWEIYEKETKPIVSHLEKEGVLIIHVDANPPIKEVKKKVLERLRLLAKV
jgi:adenylate kinase